MRRRLRAGLLAGLLLAPVLCGRPAGAGEGRDVRIGVLAYQGSERAAQDWEPTIANLNRAIPGRRFDLVALDLDGMATAVKAGSVDFVITNPGDYVTLEAQFAVTRIATLESDQAGSPSAAVASTIIARDTADAPVTLADLKGLRLALVATDAFGGFQVMWREMADSGIDPFSDLSSLEPTGFPMVRVAFAVRDGAADAGILRSCELERMIADGTVAPGEFRVVGERKAGGEDLPCRVSSRLYPDWPFARLAHTPRDLAKSVAAALLTMPETDGKSWTAPLDYTGVHDLFRRLKIGPYSRLAHPDLAGLVLLYWQWLVAAAAGVLWWVAHVARVEHLVRRRTAQLEHEIAERIRAEEAAARHQRERDRFSRLAILGEMASNIAHELNQPMAAITNYAHGIVRMLDASPLDRALVKDGAAAAAEQAERAALIIQRIRGFVRRRAPQHSAVDVNDLIREALGLFESLLGRRGIAIHVHLADTLPPVQADKVEIQQVLLNLLQNAVDATLEAGAPEAAITVRSSQAADGMVKVAVRDAGPGLDAEAKAHLFEPFFTTKPDGLGLGLSICRTIVEGYGGRLWAAPNPDHGVTMRFTLPAGGAAGPA